MSTAMSFALVRSLHVIAAAVVLGALVTLPLLRPRLQSAEDSRWASEGLGFVATVERWVLAPGVLALGALGFAMVEGPLARFSFTAEGAGWLHLGATLWLLLAGCVAVMWVSRRGLQERAQEGATGGDRVWSLWRRWTAGAVVGALSVAFGIAVMGMRLGA